MKYLSTTILSLALIQIISCTSDAEKENAAMKAELDKLKKENVALRGSAEKLNVSIDTYKKFLEEVDKNLKEIDDNQTMVGQLKADMNTGATVDQRIRGRISAINELMKNSRLRILTLDRNLNQLRKISGVQSDEVLQLNRDLKMQAQNLMTKESELESLRNDLEGEIEDLGKLYEEQVALTEELRQLLNRAFFYSGTAKDLKDKQIVDTEGGFIGIGRVKILNANSPDKLFTQIGKDSTDSIAFEGNIKIITEHPGDSYVIAQDENGTSLNIMDKAAFWKQGNYLVVQVK